MNDQYTGAIISTVSADTTSSGIELSVLTLTVPKNTDIVAIKGEQYYSSNPYLEISGGHPGEKLYIRYISFESDPAGVYGHAQSQGWLGKEGEIVFNTLFNSKGIAYIKLNCGGCNRGYDFTAHFVAVYNGIEIPFSFTWIQP